MFGFSRRPGSDPSDELYQKEFQRLAARMWNQHEVDSTPHDELLHAMAVIENELIEGAGQNWDEEDHPFYLDIIRDRLVNESGVSSDVRVRVEEAARTILQFGQQVEATGKSAIETKLSLNYLIARVVDWCRVHPQA